MATSEIYSTKILFELRLQLDVDVKVGPLTELRKIRVEWQQNAAGLVEQLPSQIKLTLISYARRVWSELSKPIFSKSVYSLPPIYESGLNTVLSNGLFGMYLRESDSCPAATNGDHMVLGGVEGCGKSTLLRAFALAATVLFSVLTPVVWDYSTDDGDGTELHLPKTILTEATTTLSAALGMASDDCKGGESTAHTGGNEVDLKGAFARFSTSKRRLFLLLDEFQLVFVMTTKVERAQRNQNIAKQTCALARMDNTYCMLAGSSSQLRRMLFRVHGGGPDMWVDYGNFNGTLFSIVAVPALRCFDDLKSYVQRRYPTWDVTDQQIQQLLCNTGGIGRHVHYASREENVLRKPNRRGVISDPKSTTNLGYIAALIITAHRTCIDANAGTMALPCLGIPYAAAVAQLHVLGVLEADVQALTELGLLYIVKNERDEPLEVQLAIPYDLYRFVDVASKDFARSALQLCAMVMMCITNENVNAGVPMENLLRPRAVRLFNERELEFSADKLVIKGGKLYIEGNEAQAQNLNKKFFAWSVETGLDGVGFKFEAGFKKCVLYLWQNKGGHFNNQITGGQMATSRKKYAETKTVTGLDDTAMHGILVKAEVGCAAIVDSLLNTVPGIAKVRVAGFVLTTTKSAAKGMAMLSGMHDELTMPGSLFKQQGKVDRTVSVKVLDGLRWVRQCLPTELVPLLPEHWDNFSVVDTDTPVIGSIACAIQ
jgi:hypothetical protein